MQMNGMAELITIKRYWQQWDDPRLIVAMLHNNDLNQVTWEMRAMAGAPKFVESQALPDVDYAGFAASLGFNAATIKDPEELGGAWDERAVRRPAHGAGRVHDPDMPPIPPHATWEQFKAATTAVLEGDEDRWGFVKKASRPRRRSCCRTRTAERASRCPRCIDVGRLRGSSEVTARRATPSRPMRPKPTAP